ncbi:hypothetical protein [Streptomyces sp. NBC_01233]|uniref:hypothetical protein n=1 Tax=Streptomyces sp. NBC_01233 TaxID=2903787 RepID=UPI002E10A7E2|nr:hypothetical protein OG332_17220 [Streptomyces sp. NBC_01233]
MERRRGRRRGIRAIVLLLPLPAAGGVPVLGGTVHSAGEAVVEPTGLVVAGGLRVVGAFVFPAEGVPGIVALVVRRREPAPAQSAWGAPVPGASDRGPAPAGPGGAKAPAGRCSRGPSRVRGYLAASGR